ncbi:CopD family protein [Anaplasma bovis]|uniref:CopD family protein n=1 Tax=Anaplasma bovis TaxID=186733 RepID=UPI002FEE9DBE
MDSLFLWVLACRRWILAFHIISVMMWVAGMLYLPRLYVYHAGVPKGSESSTLLSLMEYRLLTYIMNPSMVSAVTLGLLLAISGKAYLFIWFQIKAVFIVLMLSLHCLFLFYRRKLSLGTCTRSAVFFKVLNEAVTVAVVCMVIMATVKPFR